MLTPPETQHLVVPPDLNDEQQAIYDALGAVPEYRRYRTSEEVAQGFEQLYEEYRDGDRGVVARFEEIPLGNEPDARTRKLWIIEPAGLSREESEALPNAFIPGNAHTNEVIWTLTYDFLPRVLCERPDLLRMLGHRWLFWDIYPEGLALNGEELFAEADISLDFLLNNLGRAHIVPEWGLGVQYKLLNRTSSLPEAKALEYIIDTYRPAYAQALHNTLLNSLTYTRWRSPTFHASITRLRNAIRPAYPPATAGSDLAHAEMLAPGIYYGVDAQVLYEDLAKTTGSEQAAATMVGGNNIPGYQRQMVEGGMSTIDESGYLISHAIVPPDRKIPKGAFARSERATRVGSAHTYSRLYLVVWA